MHDNISAEGWPNQNLDYTNWKVIPIKIMSDFSLGFQLMKGQIKYQHYFQPLKVFFLKSSFKS